MIEMPRKKRRAAKKKKEPIGLTWDKVKVGCVIKKAREVATVPENWDETTQQILYEQSTCLGLMLNVVGKNEIFKYITCTLHSIPVTEIRKKCSYYSIRDYHLPDWDIVDAPIGGYVTYETAIEIAKVLGGYEDGNRPVRTKQKF